MVDLDAQKMEDFKGRYGYCLIILGVAFVLLSVQLWYLQTLRGNEFRRISENNCIRIREHPADRGLLIDRKGRILAQNRPCFEVYLIPEDLKQHPEVVGETAQLLNLNQEQIEAKIRGAKRRAPFKPIRIKPDIEWSELAVLESNRVHLPGLWVDVRPKRTYNYGTLASHLIGYLGEVDEEDLRQTREASYRTGAMIGKYGVEYQWESDLRGTDGGQQVEVDALGREIRPIRSVESFPGNNLVLTIDLDLQTRAEEAFQDKIGALIAMDPRSGRILAMISKPSFDPDLFARSIPAEEWKALTENPFHPLQNKGIQGQYPPGSVFKIVTALAGLESGALSPDTTFHCNGAFHYGNRDFRCWKEGGHGMISLRRAIVESCDIYFYQAGLKMGVDTIARYAAEFGLGKKTGIALPHEKAGTVPSSSWKKKRFGVPWYSGETLSFAVGQGYMNATPIQLVTFLSAVANGGKLFLPQAVERVDNIFGKTVKEYPPVETGKARVSERSLRFVQDALTGAVNDPHGTGGGSALKNVRVAGKTGTAQVVRMAQDFRKGDTQRLPLKLRDHAWFGAFAPAEDPRIALIVLVEHGGFGAAAAVPIAKQVFEKFFELETSSGSNLAAQAGAVKHDDD